MRLGVLDQSPVTSGHAPAQAVRETITGSYDSRLRSYELLAGAFKLKGPGQRDRA